MHHTSNEMYYCLRHKCWCLHAIALAMTTIYLYDMASFNCITFKNNLIDALTVIGKMSSREHAGARTGGQTRIKNIYWNVQYICSVKCLCRDDRTEKHFNKSLITRLGAGSVCGLTDPDRFDPRMSHVNVYLALQKIRVSLENALWDKETLHLLYQYK